MKRRNLLLKVAALATSILLVGGFIAYRVGAFERFRAAEPLQTQRESTLADPAAMYSSKSGQIVPVPAKRGETEPPTVISGTKSLLPPASRAPESSENHQLDLTVENPK